MYREDGPEVSADRAAALVLGACLRNPEAMSDCAPLLRGADFRAYGDGCIWDACLCLHSAGKPVDPLSVFDELSRRGTLADAGGAARLATLAEHNYAAAAVTYHANAVKDHSLLRGLAQAGAEIAHAAAHPTAPAREVLADAERRIFALSQVGVEGQARSLAEVLAEAMEGIAARMEARARGVKVSGIASGLQQLDNYTGGFRGGQLCLLAARPSVGKTAVAASFACHAAAQGRRVLFCSLEQSDVELAERLLSAESGVTLHLLREGNLPLDRFTGAVMDARDELSDRPLSLDDAPTQSVLRVAASARRMKARGGLDLLVIDYLQLLDPEDRKAPQHEQIAANSVRLKALARELDVPVLALAQLNREVEGRGDGKPRLSDLRGSGQLEQDADLVILLHRPRDAQHSLEVIIAKQRNGPVGEFAAAFDRERMRFGDAANNPHA